MHASGHVCCTHMKELYEVEHAYVSNMVKCVLRLFMCVCNVCVLNTGTGKRAYIDVGMRIYMRVNVWLSQQ